MATLRPATGTRYPNSFSDGAAISSYGIAADATNYRDVFGFDNQPDSTNLPQIYEREVTIYGNRSLMGFLRMIGSEMPTNSQQIRWAEQRRLHVFYDRLRATAAITAGATSASFNVLPSSPSTSTDALANHSVRENDKVLVQIGTAQSAVLGFISNKTNAGQITVQFYNEADVVAVAAGNLATTDVSILVIGSEVGKGSDSRDEVLQPEYDSYVNNTVIQRDTFAVNGTDANQIGWVEIADENGVQGKYWYLKGKSETMTRWEDYQETALLEDRRREGFTALNKNRGTTQPFGGFNSVGTAPVNAQRGGVSQAGSEGLFEAIENRGNVTTGGFGQSSDGFRADIDRLIEQLDKEGNIEENVFYLDRTESLAFDDGMAAQNNGTGGTSSSWGIFNNSENMGLSLGFNSVRRGSYDFYKKDWKYLNQVDGRGSFNGVKGVSVPMGTKSVYDQYGANLSMPFASIHYLAGPMGSRQNQSWVHGGQAPTPTSGIDSMTIEFLSEKCVCLKGANNFFLFK